MGACPTAARANGAQNAACAGFLFAGLTFKEWPMRKIKSAASRLLALCGVIGLSVTGCATDSVVVTGKVRPAISPAEVKVYWRPPVTFEEIAILNTSKNSAFTTGGQKTIDKVIAGLKEQAAKVGANGVILEGFSDRQTGAIGSGVGSSSVSSNSAVGVGVGGSLGIYKKTGHGVAIFVPPGFAPPPGSQPEGRQP
jgi:hypothetical protein